MTKGEYQRSEFNLDQVGLMPLGEYATVVFDGLLFKAHYRKTNMF